MKATNNRDTALGEHHIMKPIKKYSIVLSPKVQAELHMKLTLGQVLLASTKFSDCEVACV